MDSGGAGYSGLMHQFVAEFVGAAVVVVVEHMQVQGPVPGTVDRTPQCFGLMVLWDF